MAFMRSAADAKKRRRIASAASMVRAWRLEPQRLSAREPKGYITLVKDFKSPQYHKRRNLFPALFKKVQL